MFKGTTIVAIKKGDHTAIAGDGQVTFGQNTIMKSNANKTRRLYDGKVIAGFAGAVADAFTLFAKFEEKLKQVGGNLTRASVEIAREWRSDRVLRKLEALLIVADKEKMFIISGNGEAYSIEFNTALAGTDVDQLVITNAGIGAAGSMLTATQGRAAGYPEKPENAVSGSKDVYDSQGNKVTVYYRFFKYEITPGSEPGVIPVVDPVTRWACDLSTDPLFEKQEGYLANTDFSAMDLESGAVTVAGGDKIFRLYNVPFDKMGNMEDPDQAKFTYSINRQVPPPGHGTANISCTIDFAGLTQRAGESSAWASYQDGYGQGSLTSYSVGNDGTITGEYNNGQKRDLARVALASFENPAGLQQVGGTLFAVSNNSGDAHIGAPLSQGLGKIIPSTLEMSNVDLSEEFTDMIVTQRGFQANSRIITTSDEMLQELVNLKR
jgi:flagellar hook protein FlgE